MLLHFRKSVQFNVMEPWGKLDAEKKEHFVTHHTIEILSTCCVLESKALYISPNINLYQNQGGM